MIPADNGMYRFVLERIPNGFARVKPKDCSAPPLPRRSVLVQLISSCNTAREQHLLMASREWCSRGSGLACSVYLDAECKARLQSRLGLQTPGAALMQLVSPREYLQAWPPAHNCCDKDVPFTFQVLRKKSGPQKWDGMGPSVFFCRNKHRNVTFSHQFRFIPALAHARHVHLSRFRSMELKWLVQIDDDTIVGVPRLLRVLSRLNPRERLQLGDFSLPVDQTATHWRRPYAIGGAGTIFSQAAVVATDFGNCAARFRSACLQSDWMIALCASKYNVVPVLEYGCDGGRMTRSDEASAALVQRLREPGNDACTFVHLYPYGNGANRHMLQGWQDKGLVSLLARRNALFHASPFDFHWTVLHSKSARLRLGLPTDAPQLPEPCLSNATRVKKRVLPVFPRTPHVELG